MSITLTCTDCDDTFKDSSGLHHHKPKGICRSMRAKEVLEQIRSYSNNWGKTDKGRAHARKNSAKQYLKFGYKKIASRRLRYAVSKGWVEKLACEKCGEIKVQAHHNNGYENPYDVIWLCLRHHRLEHGRYIDI